MAILCAVLITFSFQHVLSSLDYSNIHILVRLFLASAVLTGIAFASYLKVRKVKGVWEAKVSLVPHIARITVISILGLWINFMGVFVVADVLSVFTGGILSAAIIATVFHNAHVVKKS